MGIWQGVQHVLGLGAEPKDLTFFQISLRGIIVFIATLIMLRVADKRFLAKMTAFDAILGLTLASVLSRAINGSSAFFATIGGGFVLVLFHRLLATLAFRWHWFGGIVKGKAEVLVEEGEKKPAALRRNKITDADLLEELRLNGQVTAVDQVEVATIERSGEISVVPVKDK